jgi:hypothetical protein
VYVPYCTSDGWAGTARSTAPAGSPFNASDITTWSFRGRAVLQAVLSDLAQFKGLSVAAGAEALVFSGCSAGGQGVLVNTDAVRTFFAAASNPPLPVYSLADAGWLMNLAPDPSTNRPSLGLQIVGAMSMWGAQFHSQCMVDKRPSGTTWQCFFGEYVAPYFAGTPTLIQAESYDAFQLWYGANVQTMPPPPAVAPWVQSFHQAFLSTMAANENNVNLFAPACHWHCNSQDQHWLSILTQEGISLHDALQRVIDGAYVYSVDTCDPTKGGCTQGCPSN